MKTTFFKRIVATLATIALTVGMIPTATAAGVTMTATPSALTGGAATDVVLTYTAGSTYDATDEIVIIAPNGWTLAAHTTPDTDADAAGGTADGAFAYDAINGSGTNNRAIYTFTGASATNSISLQLKVTGTANSIGDLSLSVSDVSSTTTNNDFSTVLIYTDTENVVTVTATVEPYLAMSLDANTMAFGTLSPGTAKKAGSVAAPDTPDETEITINTNAANGYQLQASAAAFTGGVTGSTISEVAGDDTDISGATYGWGINAAITQGTTLGGAGSSTLAAAYDTVAATNVSRVVTGPYTLNDTTNNEPISGDVVAVSYWANVDPTQPADTYSTTVTYTLTAQF